MKSPEKRLVELDIKIKDDDVLLTPHYDTIVRVRRITGYLSNVKNFKEDYFSGRLLTLLKKSVAYFEASLKSLEQTEYCVTRG